VRVDAMQSRTRERLAVRTRPGYYAPKVEVPARASTGR